jgi:hypothetical protein
LGGTATSRRAVADKYAVLLLFQYRVVVNDVASRRRIVEKRPIHLNAASPAAALRQARKNARREQFDGENTDGIPDSFEFLGVLDLLQSGIESDEATVWWDVGEVVEPLERREKILPTDNDLITFRGRPARPGRPA